MYLVDALTTTNNFNILVRSVESKLHFHSFG